MWVKNTTWCIAANLWKSKNGSWGGGSMGACWFWHGWRCCFYHWWRCWYCNDTLYKMCATGIVTIFLWSQNLSWTVLETLLFSLSFAVLFEAMPLRKIHRRQSIQYFRFSAHAQVCFTVTVYCNLYQNPKHIEGKIFWWRNLKNRDFWVKSGILGQVLKPGTILGKPGGLAAMIVEWAEQNVAETSAAGWWWWW